MIETEINNCIKEYRDMLKNNEYIDFEWVNYYLKKYDDIFNNIIKLDNNKVIKEIANNYYKDIERHNDKYVKSKVRENKRYFDLMFRDVDSSINLDEEQRKAIVSDEKYSLIIAGAGAGKTTTMAAKVKYLIEKRHVDPSKIIVISYTNKATNELEDRIKYEFKLPVNIMTFHSLGITIVRKLFDQPLVPVSPKEQEEIIINFVKDILFEDKVLLEKYIYSFNKYPDLNNNKMFSSGFISNYKKFKTFDEYFADYKNRKYKENFLNIKNIINYKINFYQDNMRTIKNENVKSKGEVNIANYLFLNGIDYKYEEPYPEKVDDDKAYLPDFTIFADDEPIYIEYYGLSSYYQNGTLSKKDRLKYEDIRSKKQAWHKKHKNRYIELDYLNGNSNYIEELKKMLKEYGVVLKKRTDREIYNQILDNNTKAEFFKFVEYMVSLINEIKSSVNRDNMKKIIEDYIYDSNLSNHAKYEMIDEVNLFFKLYNYYNKQIIPKNRIDFSDMIYYANNYLTKLDVDNDILDYEYIIIDEYQDISFDRYNFAKNVSFLSKAKVVSVGDDWQTIYSFSGSRIDLFYRYNELFGGAKKLFINSTYRNSQQLIDIAGNFIMKNPFQIKKSLRSKKRRESPIKINYYTNDQYRKVTQIIDKIYRQNKTDKVMILSRKNKTIEKLIDSGYFKKGIDTRIIYNKYPDMIIDAMSVHSSKGLGADQVILLNCTNNDFPCKGYKEIWLKELFKPNGYIEDYPYAEDRRIFYVALTRTKKDIYLMVPYDKNKRSIFIDEIIEK